MGVELDIAADTGDYGFGVSTEEDGDWSLSIGKDATEDAPPAEPATMMETVTRSPYLVPGAIALALIVAAALVSPSGQRS